MQRQNEYGILLTAKSHENARKVFRSFFASFRAFSRLNSIRLSTVLFIFISLAVGNAFAQTKKSKEETPAEKTKKQTISNLPKVTQIDAEALKTLLKPNGKPLLINFWATWCEPCREEFPDLVKIGADYKDKIDVITISLDELSELNGDVPKFLAQMKAEMPAYLLKTPDEGAAIAFVSKDWQGGLPFTILFNQNGDAIYSKQGKFKTELLRAEIDRITTKNYDSITDRQIVNLPNLRAQYTYEKGKDDARIDIANKKFIIRTYGCGPGTQQNLIDLRKRYGIEIFDDSMKPMEYLTGYNEISKAEIKRKFGLEF